MWLQPSFLGFPVNRLAAEDDPSGDICDIVIFSVFGWFDSGVGMLIWDLYFMYITGMMHYELQLLFGGNCMDS